MESVTYQRITANEFCSLMSVTSFRVHLVRPWSKPHGAQLDQIKSSLKDYHAQLLATDIPAYHNAIPMCVLELIGHLPQFYFAFSRLFGSIFLNGFLFKSQFTFSVQEFVFIFILYSDFLIFAFSLYQSTFWMIVSKFGLFLKVCTPFIFREVIGSPCLEVYSLSTKKMEKM